ncbi:MAG: FAD binding domain-containing protein [Deltaproteobacteria bacterium]|nr:FAD binding domain-containing protein [Deltaproteobacteria bacterium]
MIRFPTSPSEVPASAGGGPSPVIRAGGTDLTERRRLRLAPGPLIDLRDVIGLDSIDWAAGAATVGARVTVAQAASDPALAAAYPGLAAAAGSLATPQIRAVATIGGNLLQANRCWYFRNPDHRCLKSGGDTCLARAGDHLYHACFDRGPCACVHPSTLGMALLAYEAQVAVHEQPERSIEALYGDGSDPSRDHQLPDGALLTHVVMPAPVPLERAAYFRTISRARAEWPLVEALVRLGLRGSTIEFARVAVGGVAPVPLRLPAVEAALVGNAMDRTSFGAAANKAREGASPLPMTGYKVDLVEGTVLEALERASYATPSAVGADAAGSAGAATPKDGA